MFIDWLVRMNLTLINSAVGKVLFDQLGLPVIKKTKTSAQRIYVLKH